MEQAFKKFTGDRRVQQWAAILLLVLVFLCFFLFLYAQFRQATIQALSEVSRDFVDWVNTVSDAAGENIRTSAMQMFYTSSVRTLRTDRNLSVSSRTVGLRDLGTFVSSSDFLDSVMVYNGAMNMIFTSEGNYPSAPPEQFHDSDAVQLLTHPEQYPYLSPIQRTVGGRRCYSFLFFEANGDTPSALLLNVNGNWYETHLLGISAGQGHIIANSSGEPIVSTDENLLAQLQASWPALKEQLIAQPDSGQLLPPLLSSQPCWMYYRLTPSGWYYFKCLDFNDISPALARVRDVLLLSFGLAGSLIVAVLIYLAVRVYLPFLHIRRALQQAGESPEDLPGQVSELMASQRRQEDARVLQRLRDEGKLPPDTVLPAVILLCEERDPSRLQSLLEPVCSEPRIASDEGGTVCLISSCTKENRFRLLALLRQENIPACAGFSCFTVEELCHSQAELEELRRMRFLYPNQPVLEQEQLALCNSVSGFQAKMAVSLVGALRSAQLETARNEWESILKAIQKDRYADFCFAIRYLCRQLAGLQKELGASPTVSADSILDGLRSLETLTSYIDDQLCSIAQLATARQKERLARLCNRVWEQIRAHYAEEAFSAQQIAATFDVNAAYLNRQFRQSAGISISDALHQIRIEQACRLLRQTGEPAELIAQKVGYSNIKYFFVIFKKLTGSTPRQYREAAES